MRMFSAVPIRYFTQILIFFGNILFPLFCNFLGVFKFLRWVPCDQITANQSKAAVFQQTFRYPHSLQNMLFMHVGEDMHLYYYIPNCLCLPICYVSIGSRTLKVEYTIPI